MAGSGVGNGWLLCGAESRLLPPSPTPSLPPVNRIFANNAVTTTRRGETRYRLRSHRGRISAKNTSWLVHSRSYSLIHFLPLCLFLAHPIFFCFAPQARVFMTRELNARQSMRNRLDRLRHTRRCCLLRMRVIKTQNERHAVSRGISEYPIYPVYLVARISPFHVRLHARSTLTFLPNDLIFIVRLT